MKRWGRWFTSGFDGRWRDVSCVKEPFSGKSLGHLFSTPAMLRVYIDGMLVAIVCVRSNLFISSPQIHVHYTALFYIK